MLTASPEVGSVERHSPGTEANIGLLVQRHLHMAEGQPGHLVWLDSWRQSMLCGLWALWRDREGIHEYQEHQQQDRVQGRPDTKAGSWDQIGDSKPWAEKWSCDWWPWNRLRTVTVCCNFSSWGCYTMTCHDMEFWWILHIKPWTPSRHRHDIDAFLWLQIFTSLPDLDFIWFTRSSFLKPKPLALGTARSERPVGLRFRKLLQGIVWLQRFNLWMRPLCQGHQPTLWSCLGMPSMSIRLEGGNRWNDIGWLGAKHFSMKRYMVFLGFLMFSSTQVVRWVPARRRQCIMQSVCFWVLSGPVGVRWVSWEGW